MTTPALRHRAQVLVMRARLVTELEGLPGAPEWTFVDRLARCMLEGCIRDLDAALAGVCPEQPGLLRGKPIGQYHCPYCGCMTIAGIDEHFHDDSCWLGLGEDLAPDGPESAD